MWGRGRGWWVVGVSLVLAGCPGRRAPTYEYLPTETYTSTATDPVPRLVAPGAVPEPDAPPVGQAEAPPASPAPQAAAPERETLPEPMRAVVREPAPAVEPAPPSVDPQAEDVDVATPAAPPTAEGDAPSKPRRWYGAKPW